MTTTLDHTEPVAERAREDAMDLQCRISSVLHTLDPRGERGLTVQGAIVNVNSEPGSGGLPGLARYTVNANGRPLCTFDVVVVAITSPRHSVRRDGRGTAWTQDAPANEVISAEVTRALGQADAAPPVTPALRTKFMTGLRSALGQA